jgi:DNA-binding LacI/PurR family transcriptional regulator
MLALSLWSQMEAIGMSVPNDLSIVGIDGIEAEAHGLTSVEFSFADIGRKAVEGLVARLQGAPASECCHIVPGRLHTRRSVKDLKASP